MDFSEIIVTIIISLVIIAINALGSKKKQEVKNQQGERPLQDTESHETTVGRNSDFNHRRYIQRAAESERGSRAGRRLYPKSQEKATDTNTRKTGRKNAGTDNPLHNAGERRCSGFYSYRAAYNIVTAHRLRYCRRKPYRCKGHRLA